MGKKHSRRADVGFYCQHCTRESRQYSLGINISFLSSRKQPQSKKVKEGVNGKLFTQLSPLNAKWLVFTSVKFHSILSGFLLFFPNGLLTERPANGCCLRNLAADYRSCSLMRATCCYNSMKFETCCLMMS